MSPTVRRYVASALVGLLAGGLYQVAGVRSPAPPWVALTGLLGLLSGEYATRRVADRLRRTPETPQEEAR